MAEILQEVKAQIFGLKFLKQVENMDFPGSGCSDVTKRFGGSWRAGLCPASHLQTDLTNPLKPNQVFASLCTGYRKT